MRVYRKRNRDAVMRDAIKQLNVILKEVRRRPLLLMLSGGSALELLAGINMQNIGRHVTLAVLDERYHTDPAVNNFSQVSATEFYRRAEKRGVDYIDTRVKPSDTLKRFAARFDKRLHTWKKQNPKGIVIAIQGIGPDGHTAGIMPYPENPRKFKRLFDDEHVWAVGYNATRIKTDYPFRVTVTLPFLREKIDKSLVYATGANKQKALGRVFASRGLLSRTPARIIYEMKDARMFTDQ